MKRTLFILVVLLLCVCVFAGCDDVSHREDGSQTTAPDSTDKPDDIVAGINATQVWDRHHPDDSERNPITLESIPNVEFKRENSSVYANDELLIGGPGYACMSFYTAKLTETDKTLLCFGMSCGSGICDERIVIMDFDTKQELLTVQNRMNYDYQLFVRNGILCVREIKYSTNEITRTGVFYDAETNIQILWDDNVVLDEDGNQAQSKYIMLLPDGVITNVGVSSIPEGYNYSFVGEDAKTIVDYLSNLNLEGSFEEKPNEYGGMTWVISLKYEEGDAFTVYHFGNMFIRSEKGPWYKMDREEAIRFDALLSELSN